LPLWQKSLDIGHIRKEVDEKWMKIWKKGSTCRGLDWILWHNFSNQFSFYWLQVHVLDSM